MIFESCPCLWKGEGELKEPNQSLSPPTKPEDQAEQRVEGGRALACGSWRRWLSGLLPFFPFTAAIALTLHYLACEYSCFGVLDVSQTSPVLKMCQFRHAQSHKCTCLKSTSSSPAPPSSVFFLGGSVEFPNLSFSSELTDSTSPQFRLQAQALNHYVSWKQWCCPSLPLL